MPSKNHSFRVVVGGAGPPPPPHDHAKMEILGRLCLPKTLHRVRLVKREVFGLYHRSHQVIIRAGTSAAYFGSAAAICR